MAELVATLCSLITTFALVLFLFGLYRLCEEYVRGTVTPIAKLLRPSKGEVFMPDAESPVMEMFEPNHEEDGA